MYIRSLVCVYEKFKRRFKGVERRVEEFGVEYF